MNKRIELDEKGSNRFVFLQDNLSIEVYFHHGFRRWAYDIEGRSYPSGTWKVLDRGCADSLDEIRFHIEDVLKIIKYGDCSVVIVTEIDKLFEEAVFNEGF